MVFFWVQSLTYPGVEDNKLQVRVKVEVSTEDDGGYPKGVQRLKLTVYAVKDITDRKSTRLNSSHSGESRMPSSA